LNDAVIIRRKAMPIPVDKYASHEEYETARREFIGEAETLRLQDTFTLFMNEKV